MDLFGPNATFLERLGIIFAVVAGASFLLVIFYKLFVRGKAMKLDMFGTKVDIAGNSVITEAGKDALVDVFTMSITTASTVSFLKTKQILSDQMYYLEDKLILIQEALTTSYRTCLSATLKKMDDHAVTVTSHKEYQFFTSLVTLMVEDTKRTCRQVFIKNNFSNFSDKDFNDYIDEKVVLLKAKSLLFLRDLYPSDKMVVTFEVVEQDVFLKESEAIGDHLEHVFRKAVHIYKARHEEADKLDHDLKAYILATYGVDIDAPRKVAQENKDA